MILSISSQQTPLVIIEIILNKFKKFIEKIRIQKFLDEDQKRIKSEKLLSAEQTRSHKKRLIEIDAEITAQKKFEQ